MAYNGGIPTGAGFGGPKSVYFSNDEEVVSNKLNNLQLFLGTELTDIVARLTASDQTGLYGGTNPNGVLTGFEPTISGLTMTVAAGLGFTSNPGNPNGNPPDASQSYQWIRSVAPQPITLTPNTSGSYSLWALIYASANEVPSAYNAAPQWNPALNAGAGGIQIATLPQRQDPSAQLSVVYGTAGLSPVPPALPPSSIAVAYVSLGPSSATPTNANVYDVRTILSPGMYGMTGIISGLQMIHTPLGGFISFSAGRAYVNGFLIQLDSNSGVRTLGSFLGGGMPGVNTVYYLYAVPTSQGQIPTVSQTDGSYFQNLPPGRPGSGFQVVATTTPPNALGLAPSGLALNPGYGTVASSAVVVPTNAAGVSNALFVGSVITDGSGNLIPFARSGDYVTLSPPPSAQSGVVAQFDGGAAFSDVPWAGGVGSYPQTQSAAFAAVPLTSTAVIVDASLQCSPLKTVALPSQLNATVEFINSPLPGIAAQLSGTAFTQANLNQTIASLVTPGFTPSGGQVIPLATAIAPVTGLYRLEVSTWTNAGSQGDVIGMFPYYTDPTVGVVSGDVTNGFKMTGSCSTTGPASAPPYLWTQSMTVYAQAGSPISISAVTQNTTAFSVIYSSITMMNGQEVTQLLNSTGQFEVPTAGSPSVSLTLLSDPGTGNTVHCYVVYRGYVEPLSKLKLL